MKNKIYKISSLMAIAITVASTIGAGIFFKNASIFNNVNGNLWLVIFSWIVSGIGIIAIGISIVELSSASKKERGILEWVKIFCPKRFYKYSSSYMLLIYIPLTYVGMPIYLVQSLQDTLGIELHGWAVAFISLGFLIWFAALSWFSHKSATKLQTLFGILKFIPIILVPIVALIQGSQTGFSTNINGSSTTGLTSFSPYLGIFASIPAILFAMDGFYSVTSLRSQLTDKKKMGIIISLGVSIIIMLYLLFAILSGIEGALTFNDLKIVQNNKWLSISINAFILVAVMGIVNGYTLTSTQIYLNIHNDSELGVVSIVKKMFKIKSDKFAAFFSSIFYYLLWFIILVPISIYFWYDSGNYGVYGPGANEIYSMTDLITNFTSLFIFIFIGFAIFEGIKNRKSNRIKVRKAKFFLISSWIAIIFLILGTTYMFVMEFVNIFIYYLIDKNNDAGLSQILKFTVLLISVFVAAIPIIYKKFKNKNNKNIEYENKTLKEGNVSNV